ncbi:hypothetical protein ACFTZB_33535 [Rhodococcus sp. NPDC057014]|uniref:hypothetical protein n=1 Tax=Rhodococcus sp. NPDC057014 TaxID=3346000 RepID=UPI003640B186
MRFVLRGQSDERNGAQEQSLAVTDGMPHISTGELFRTHISANTALDKDAYQYVNIGERADAAGGVDAVNLRADMTFCANAVAN